MNYFVKGTGQYNNYIFQDKGFEKIEVFLNTHCSSTLTSKFFSTLALRYPHRFENSFLSSLYPFEEISYLLMK
jgi:hypothetical protein